MLGSHSVEEETSDATFYPEGCRQSCGRDVSAFIWFVFYLFDYKFMARRGKAPKAATKADEVLRDVANVSRRESVGTW